MSIMSNPDAPLSYAILAHDYKFDIRRVRKHCDDDLALRGDLPGCRSPGCASLKQVVGFGASAALTMSE
jgi:hypothetical protein